MIRRLVVAAVNAAAAVAVAALDWVDRRWPCAFPNLTNTDPDQEDQC